MLAILSWASAASGMLGKNVMKSRYSCSACASDAVPPSAYEESPTASLARAINSESGYVLIKVCSVMRATSKRLCFIASMALSNSTLSGCLEPTLAKGLTDFLLVQAAVTSSNMPTTATKELRRNIRPRDVYVGRAKLGFLYAAKTKLSRARLPLPPSAAFLHSFLDHRFRTRRCPPPEFLRPPAPRHLPYRAQSRHLLRCGSLARVDCESQPSGAFCAAFPE